MGFNAEDTTLNVLPASSGMAGGFPKGLALRVKGSGVIGLRVSCLGLRG